MAESYVPHFHNTPGVPVIEIGAKEFMCVGAEPPFDHPHVFLDMGDADRDHLPLLLDPVPRRCQPRSACRAPAGMRADGNRGSLIKATPTEDRP